MDATGNVVQVFVALAAVVGLVLLCAFVARRVLGGVHNGGAGGQIRILAVRPLGSRERLVLVEVGGEVTLLGVTQHGISALRQLPPGVADGLPSVPRFSDALSRLMGKNQ